ncbi:MAG: triose-phosphate isomerase [Desulfuromonas sp.]|nr:MAG: triose-phosphate isomerase [Desulfuromonas sp.]
MRTPVIAGNWKLHNTIEESITLVEGLKTAAKEHPDREVIVAPVFTALTAVAAALKESPIQLSAQNCYFENQGAFTGEVSPTLLKDAGCSHVILGHSERRQIFGEDNSLINAKVKATLTAGLKVILCIGETLQERESGSMYDILTTQVAEGLSGIGAGQMEDIIIAYEPVWAIGTGVTATTDQAEEAHSFVRGLIAGQFDKPISEAVRILYGGSVKPGNVDELLAQQNVDGALVGGASLKAEDFSRIIGFVQE